MTLLLKKGPTSDVVPHDQRRSHYSNEFERHLSGYPQLDQTPADPSLRDYSEDGFTQDPQPLPWADYRKLKSILLHVLGRRVFEVLYRCADGKIHGDAFRVSAIITMHYVNRYDASVDLQTTLIAHSIAVRANGSATHRAASLVTAERLIEMCQLEPQYKEIVKREVFEDGTLDQPWWTMVPYSN